MKYEWYMEMVLAERESGCPFFAKWEAIKKELGDNETIKEIKSLLQKPVTVKPADLMKRMFDIMSGAKGAQDAADKVLAELKKLHKEK